MSTSEAILSSDEADRSDEEFQYRPLSTAAIASVIFGLVSSVTFLAGNTSLQTCLMLCPIPAIGLICGLIAMKNIRNMPDALSGYNAAVVGTVFSALGLFGGLSYAAYVHVTEIPPGYSRVSFYDLRPDEVELKGNEAVPRDVKSLEGQPIFIKGYMRPGSHITKGGTPVRHNISIFKLVRDSNECCFGDISTVKYFDKMDVVLEEGLMTDYSRGIFRVAGKLRVLPPNPRQGNQDPVYMLEADYVH